MTYIKILTYLLVVFLLASCSSAKESVKTNKTKFYYNENKQVNALVVPPDLTIPNFDTTTDNINKLIVKTEDVLLVSSSDVIVKRNGSYRYLLVNKKPKKIWPAIENFFKQQKFSIVEQKPNIGILKTNYLKRNIKVPEQELNIIRASLQKALGTSYVLPVVDRYTVRLEKNNNSTEVYLSINSLEEINTNPNAADDGNTIWRLRKRDKEQEIAMLYQLMVFLSGNTIKSKDYIINAIDNSKIDVSIITTDANNTILKFIENKEQVWRYIGWALDNNNVSIEDKDLKEGAYYINITDKHRTKSKISGILYNLFDSSSDDKTYQLLVRQLDYAHTEVSLNYLSDDKIDNNLRKQFLTKLVNTLTK